MKELDSISTLEIGEVGKEKGLYKSVKDVFRFNFVTGLPCGELRDFIHETTDDLESVNIQATNEREAVGIAAGSWLAGKTPALYMQNSGLFEASNDIGSLLIPSKIPALFVVSWRGVPGESATQHFATGAATVPLIENFGLPYAVWPDMNALLELKGKMDQTKLPGVILVKKEKFNSGINYRAFQQSSVVESNFYDESQKIPELSRESVIESLFSGLINGNDAVISSTGLISRSVFQNHDAPNQFYNAGAFGLTSAIGLGFGMNRENVRTFVIEGDGSVLTNLGALNVIGHSGVKNLTHIVLNNGAYVSCSGESTYGNNQIPEVARIFGYKDIYNVFTQEGLEQAMSRIGSKSDLQMLNINIKCDGNRDLKRPLDMSGITTRFRSYFNEK